MTLHGFNFVKYLLQEINHTFIINLHNYYYNICLSIHYFLFDCFIIIFSINFILSVMGSFYRFIIN